VIAAIVVCVVAVAAIVIGTTGGGGSAASTDLPSTSTATVQIKRQDLVETDDENGTLGYSGSQEVINHLSGYVTWLPPQGSVIRSDHTLYSIDGSPVILMNGNLPAYRTLNPSVSGADARELERDLRALGYDPGNDMTVDRTWTSATTAAVKRWQDAHGLTQTGSIELGRIVFQPGSRRVSSLNATLGGSSSGTTGGGAASGSATTGASATTAGSSSSSVRTSSASASLAQAQAAVFRTTGTTTTPAPTPTSPSTGNNNPKTKNNSKTKNNTKTKKSTKTQTTSQTKNSSKTSSSSGTSGSSSGASSSAASPANTIMTTTSTRKVVTVDLDTTKSSLAKLGAAVTVELTSGNGVHGQIASIGKVATSSSSNSGSGSSSSGSSSSSTTATIKLTIRLFSKVTAFDQAPVTVRFEQNRVKDTLAIPVTALLAQPGGKFAVEVVEGSTRRLVSVTPGVYTSGYVQITGAGLQAGMRVTNAAVR
jgi:Putative peptidoglycan binding domain